ncbi:MAG: hypothetical protein ACLRYY_13470 [Anaerobutyricum soehngenii]
MGILKKFKRSVHIYERITYDKIRINTTVTFQAKNNLFYIFMESMESSYADKAEGGTMDVNYIPNLTKLAKENVQFSDKADKKMGSLYA